VKWWCKTLGGLNGFNEGWYFVPGESRLTTRDVVPCTDQQKWTFGWPWPMSEKAAQVIPVDFEDDPKMKALEMIGVDGTLEDFSEILSLTGECGSGRFSGFFIVDMTSADSPSSEEPQQESRVSETVFQELHELLLQGEYDSKPKAIDSSKAFVRGLERRAISGSRVIPLREHPQRDESVPQENPLVSHATKQVVNVLIPKKKRSLVEEPADNVIHNVSSLVKKKPKAT
jgi:hypothetical protein